jgi:CubicO group peptidase (beta-lactamase class C family)
VTLNIRLALVMLGLSVGSLSSADITDNWARVQMRERHIPGMVIGVYRHGRAIKVGTYGYADLEQKTPVRRNTIFEICSITKQFTAAAILLLAEDGRLNLDDPITRHLRELPDSWSPVTIRSLLQHTSGINDDAFDFDFPENSFADAIKKLTKRVPHPFRRWQYSNMGYWLLANLVSLSSGKPYFEFLQERIFRPLRMNDTHPNEQEQIIERRARGYRWNATLKADVNAPMLTDKIGSGAGGLVSTIDDLNLWSEALKRGTLLKPASRREMLRPARLTGGDLAWPDGMSAGGYGLGVFLSGTAGHRVEKHSGGWADASAQLTRFLDDDLTVVVLTNFGGWDARPFIGEVIATSYLKGYGGLQWSTTADPDPAVLRDALAVAASFRTKTPLLDRLTEAYRKEPEKNLDAWQKAEITQLKFVQRIPQGERTVFLYRDTKRNMMFVVVRDANGKIDSLMEFETPTPIAVGPER